MLFDSTFQLPMKRELGIGVIVWQIVGVVPVIPGGLNRECREGERGDKSIREEVVVEE